MPDSTWQHRLGWSQLELQVVSAGSVRSESPTERIKQVTYAPEDQQELAAAREGKPIGAPIGGDSGFLRCPGLALQIRVSDLCPDRCSHRHRSFAVTDQQTRTAETRGHGRGGYLRRYASSGTSAQCLGDRLRYFGRHVD